MTNVRSKDSELMLTVQCNVLYNFRPCERARGKESVSVM
jgi:hypothetical protein